MRYSSKQRVSHGFIDLPEVPRIANINAECADWDESEASLSQISTSIKGKSDAGAAGANGAQSKSGIDNLWEDNWDDDDIEDDFSVQLRCVHLPLGNLALTYGSCACRKAITDHSNNGPAPMAT